LSELTLLDLESIMAAPTPDIPWVLKPWLVKGDIAVLGGEPKSGKSWTLLDLSIALTSDPPRTFLGLVPVLGGPYRVLYLDAENNDTIIRVRLKKLVAGLGSPAISPDRLYIASCRGVNLDDKPQLVKLGELIDKIKPDFLVMDSFVRFHRRDENSNTEMSALYSEVIVPLTKCCPGMGIILIHHLAKPGANSFPGNMVNRVRGAGDIVAQPDQLWTIVVENDKTQTLTHQWTRWATAAEELSLSLADTPDGTGITLKALEIHQGADEYMAEQLVMAGTTGLLRKDMVKMLVDEGYALSKRSQTNLFARMCQKGLAKKSMEGHETRYKLAQDGNKVAT
jgi:RecA-family ATPase